MLIDTTAVRGKEPQTSKVWKEGIVRIIGWSQDKESHMAV